MSGDYYIRRLLYQETIISGDYYIRRLLYHETTRLGEYYIRRLLYERNTISGDYYIRRLLYQETTSYFLKMTVFCLMEPVGEMGRTIRIIEAPVDS